MLRILYSGGFRPNLGRVIIHLDFVVILSVFRQRLFISIFSNYAPQPLRLIVRSWLDVPSFATRRLQACHHARALSG